MYIYIYIPQTSVARRGSYLASIRFHNIYKQTTPPNNDSHPAAIRGRCPAPAGRHKYRQIHANTPKYSQIRYLTLPSAI